MDQVQDCAPKRACMVPAPSKVEEQGIGEEDRTAPAVAEQQQQQDVASTVDKRKKKKIEDAPSEEEEQKIGEVNKTAPAVTEQQHDVASSTVDERNKNNKKNKIEDAQQEQQEQQQVVASAVEGMRRKKKMEEALSLLRSCHARCSKMLLDARQRRVMGDLELRCLEFLEKELSYMAACLTALNPQDAEAMTWRWLHRLTESCLVILAGVLLEADSQRHTLLRRATLLCFRSRQPYPSRLWYAAERFYILSQHPFRYRHLLTAISCLGRLPPQVGIDCWFQQSPPSPYYDFHHVSYQLITFYMSMFPYGYKFEKDQLVMKWVCEGIVDLDVSLLSTHEAAHANYFAKAQAQANHYFSRLVDWNAITRPVANTRRNNPEEAEAWQWNVNPLVHQFLASKSAEMGFLFTSASLNLAAAPATDHGKETSRIPRRLALHHDDPDIPSLLQKFDLSQIHSLAVSGTVSRVSVDNFVNLLVLDVEGWEKFEDDDLLRVCRSKMLFLVYLSIRNTRVSKLPPEIKELCSLQILDASNTQITELPLGVFVGTRLRKLDLRGTLIRQVTLPKQIMGLAYTLRALLLGGEGMNTSAETAPRLPHDIWRFLHLETLATFDLSKVPASFIVKALGDLEYLKVIAITWSFHQSSDRHYCEALQSSIKMWRGLESLTIHCGFGCSMEFLGSLSHVSSDLETFKVTVGRFAGLPQWFKGHKCLSFVQITVCKPQARDLEILRDLPKLECLILGLDFIPREAIVIKNEGFRKLRRFSIDCPVLWLTFESGAMPKLTNLQLSFCACPTSPISVPSGISNLSSLAEVALWYNVWYANSSSVRMAVEAVRKEVAKRHNTSQMIGLFINGIEQDDVQAVDETQNARGTNVRAEDAVQVVDEITEA